MRVETSLRSPDGFVPPPPHETRTRQEITEMFPFFDPEILAQVEEARERVEGSQAERVARATARVGGRSEVSLDFGGYHLVASIGRKTWSDFTILTARFSSGSASSVCPRSGKLANTG
jgi:hypothetical protein